MDFLQNLKDKFEQFNIPLSSEQAENFKTYYESLLEWNERINLTTITSEDDFITKHLIDSIFPFFLIPSGTYMLDIGCGAGFPSIPLKILRPDINFVLIDSVNKKLNFVNEVIEKLNLKNIKTIHARAEDLARKDEYREKFDMVTFRAVASLNTLIEYGVPFLKIGGQMLAYKSQEVENEIIIAKNALKTLFSKIERIEKFDLLGNERNVVVIKKLSPTESKYPRSQNKPRISPL